MHAVAGPISTPLAASAPTRLTSEASDPDMRASRARQSPCMPAAAKAADPTASRPPWQPCVSATKPISQSSPPMPRINERRHPVLIRGVGDVGSAVAVLLFRAGYRVALHDDPAPTYPRRGMAFTDAVFDAKAVLDGVVARRVDQLEALCPALSEAQCVPVTVAPFGQVLEAARWPVLVDARMRKRTAPEIQRGLAPLTIGLGPHFIAGDNIDVAVETCFGDRLGAIINRGPTLPLAGEPTPLGSSGRERFVYATATGLFETGQHIGAHVVAEQVIANISDARILAPLTGTIRGLTRSGVHVTARTKVIEIDPRGDPSAAFGLGERPRRIAEGVRRAIAENGYA